MISYLEALPYQVELCAILRERWAELWQWFAEHRLTSEFATRVRLEMLKSAYRLPPEGNAPTYLLARRAAEPLGIELPITLYQAEAPERLNAAIAYAPDEVHLLFCGPVTEKLSAEETVAVFAHELAHHYLWSVHDQEYFVADQLLNALADDPEATPAQLETLRLWRLNMELFCDRAALHVVQDPLVVVAALVKLATGVTQVDPVAYLKQADEILGQEQGGTRRQTHPEGYLRARAVRLWAEAEAGVELQIERLLSGELDLDQLDFRQQVRLERATRLLLEKLLAPAWMRTDMVLAHARSYFPELATTEASETCAANWETWLTELACNGPGTQDYFSFLLLDFAAVDRDLEERPLGVCLSLAEQLGIKPRFVELAQRELRLRKRQLQEIEKSVRSSQ